MENKRGVSGGFVVTFVATIIILILVLMFLIFSSVIVASSDMVMGEVLLKEDALGITDGVGYMENYFKLVEARNLHYSGTEFSCEIGGRIC